MKFCAGEGQVKMGYGVGAAVSVTPNHPKPVNSIFDRREKGRKGWGVEFRAGNGLDILSEYVPSQRLVKNHFYNILYP